MTVEYTPQGVCAKAIRVTVEDGVVQEVEVVGGCNGNLQGITSLVKGMKAEDVVSRLEGIRCGMKESSCPDQLTKAIREAM